MLLDPSPSVTNCHTFSDPLERGALYGRPLGYNVVIPLMFQKVDEKIDIMFSWVFSSSHLGSCICMEWQR